MSVNSSPISGSSPQRRRKRASNVHELRRSKRTKAKVMMEQEEAQDKIAPPPKENDRSETTGQEETQDEIAPQLKDNDSSEITGQKETQDEIAPQPKDNGSSEIAPQREDKASSEIASQEAVSQKKTNDNNKENVRLFDSRTERAETLEEKNQRLTFELRRVQNKLDRVHGVNAMSHTMDSGWLGVAPENWAGMLEGHYDQIRNWALNNALYSTDDLAGLSGEQKHQIVDSLDGFCVQEDLDSIISRCHQPACDQVPEMLVSAMIHKHVIQKLFDRPFWYFTTRPEAGVQDDTTATLFRGELETLYQQYLEVNPPLASMWRWLTVRLANSSDSFSTHDTTFYDAKRVYLTELVPPLVDEILANPRLQCLLRPLQNDEKIENRRLGLLQIYLNIAKSHHSYYAHQHYLKFQNLQDISPEYSILAGTVSPEEDYMLDEHDNKTLNGNRILILSRPVVYVCGGWEDKNPRKVCIQGRALIEQDRRSAEKPTPPAQAGHIAETGDGDSAATAPALDPSLSNSNL